MTSPSSCCDTRPFVRTWRGWNQNQALPGGQEDAALFFRFFAEFLPKRVSQPFGIALVTRKEGEGYYAQERQSIWMLPCSAQGVGTLEASLHRFFEPLVIQDILRGDGTHIRATMTERIEAAPSVLVINLRRITYSNTTNRQEKITARISFPGELDISCFLTNSSAEYKLSGVVIHSGSAQGGHYQLLMVFNGQYCLFNDASVSQVNKATLELYGFGDRDSSAYLLFYVRKGAKVKGRDIYARSARIAAGKADVLIPAIVQLIVDVAPFRELRDFFFGIFCRSQLGYIANHFVDRFRALLESAAAKQDFLSWMVANAKTQVLPVYENCSTQEIVSSVAAIIEHTTKDIEAAEFVHMHVTGLHSCRDENIPLICILPCNYVRESNERLLFARHRNWSYHLGQCASKLRHVPGLLDAVIQLVSELGDSGEDTDFLLALPLLCPGLMNTTAQTNRIRVSPNLLRIKAGGLSQYVAQQRAARSSLSRVLLELVQMGEAFVGRFVAEINLVVGWLSDADVKVRAAAQQLMGFVVEADDDRCQGGLDHIGQHF
jgi:hypothetical protein